MPASVFPLGSKSICHRVWPVPPFTVTVPEFLRRVTRHAGAGSGPMEGERLAQSGEVAVAKDESWLDEHGKPAVPGAMQYWETGGGAPDTAFGVGGWVAWSTMKGDATTNKSVGAPCGWEGVCPPAWKPFTPSPLEVT